MALNAVLRTSVIAFAILLTGCATSAQAKRENTASTIDYTLPVSQVKVGLDLVITKCDSPANVKGAITLTASAVPSPYPQHHFRLSGAALTSFWKKRDLSIELHPNGAIKSVNGAVADRSSAILINALKIVATVGTLAVRDGTSVQCTPDTHKAFNEAKKLRNLVVPLRDSLINGTATNIPETQKQIDVLAQQIATIQGERLSIKLETNLKFIDRATGGTFKWEVDDLARHFTSPDGDIPEFDMQWRVEPKAIGCGWNCDTTAPEAQADCQDCKQTLVFREPRTVLLAVTMPNQKAVPSAALEFPMAQWGAITYFPLKARFGESKSFKLAMDEFGRRSAFTWASAARGEEITSAAGGILEAAAATRAAQESQATKAMKAEIDELETKKKWTALKRCQAIIEAGGTECPE